MMILGIDAHKRTHTVVAVDQQGKKVGQRTVAATSAGHLELLCWAGQFAERRFAVEDCRHVTRRLENELVVAGEYVVRVPTKLMAGARRSLRESGKSDSIDALSVAQAVLREENLAVAHLDGPEREVRLLCDHREDLVNERTRAQNRLRWHLHELDPTLELAARSLDRYVVLERIDVVLEAHRGTVAEIATELVERIRSLTVRINGLERQIDAMIRRLTPSLILLQGCGALSAAKILGEAADVTRFPNRARFARFNGTAPIPVSSGNYTRYRLNRGGNRQVNAAIHRIAVTQLRGGHGKDYVERCLARGKTKTEAIRGLRRRISDEVFRRLVADERAREGRMSPCISEAA